MIGKPVIFHPVILGLISISPEKISGFATDKTRDSFFRVLLKEPSETIARVIDIIPGIRANHLSGVELGLEIDAAILATDPNIPKEIPLGLSLFGKGLDFTDGNVARLHRKTRPERIDPNGQNVDVFVDRAGEFAGGVSRMKQAHDRGDKFGMVVAALSTVSGLFPSKQRAIGESLGIKHKEAGLGTRPVRAALNTAATVYPNVRVKDHRIPVQRILDTAATVFNTATIYLRAKKNRNTPEADRKLDQETRDLAKKRGPFLDKLAVLGVIGIIGSYIVINSQDGSN